MTQKFEQRSAAQETATQKRTDALRRQKMTLRMLQLRMKYPPEKWRLLDDLANITLELAQTTDALHVECLAREAENALVDRIRQLETQRFELLENLNEAALDNYNSLPLDVG
ncbi:MAG: hypothetical protein SFZ03_06575 [Candidatus Melainabacteria bacterium]|nr:hypothetical protein [Candidatus Melainabacteria bacterium]